MRLREGISTTACLRPMDRATVEQKALGLSNGLFDVVNGKKGLGVYAKTALPVGSEVGTYTGRLIRECEATWPSAYRFDVGESPGPVIMALLLLLHSCSNSTYKTL